MALIKIFFALMLLSILGAPGCQPLPEERFARPEVLPSYQATLPTSGWKPLEVEGAELAMEHEVDSAAFAIFTPSSMEKEILPLDVLSIQLLIEIKDKKIISKEYLTIGGQSAIRTLLEGRVEGEKVKIEAYVLTKEKLVYDIIYWGRPEDFASHHEDFRRLVESFRFIEQPSD